MSLFQVCIFYDLGQSKMAAVAKNSSNFKRHLLWNHWAKSFKISHAWSLGGALQSLYFLNLSEIQDGRHGVANFTLYSIFPKFKRHLLWKHWMKCFKMLHAWSLDGALPSLYFLNMSDIQDGPHGVVNFIYRLYKEMQKLFFLQNC